MTNEAIPGTFKVEKSSDPTDGDTVAPGQTVTYTVKVTHLAGVAPRNVVITDDLSDVLDDATDFTMVSSPSGTTLVNASADNGQKMSWTIAKLDDTATFVYSVKVAEDAYGASLRNVVVAPRSEYCPTAQSPAPECTTVHPTAKWTLEKSSDPASGTQIDPGDKVTYTLKATNVSDAQVTGMTVTDDLSDVLDDATLDAVPAGATLSGSDARLVGADAGRPWGRGDAVLHGDRRGRQLAGDAVQRGDPGPDVGQLRGRRCLRDDADHPGDPR